MKAWDSKGFRLGNARVSEKHANFIVHDGNATANDIEQLMEHVRNEVEKVQGISLRNRSEDHREKIVNVAHVHKNMFTMHRHFDGNLDLWHLDQSNHFAHTICQGGRKFSLSG